MISDQIQNPVQTVVCCDVEKNFEGGQREENRGFCQLFSFTFDESDGTQRGILVFFPKAERQNGFFFLLLSGFVNFFYILGDVNIVELVTCQPFVSVVKHPKNQKNF